MVSFPAVFPFAPPRDTCIFVCERTRTFAQYAICQSSSVHPLTFHVPALSPPPSILMSRAVTLCHVPALSTPPCILLSRAPCHPCT